MPRRLLRGGGSSAGLVVLCFALGLGVNASLLTVLDRLLLAGPAGVKAPGDLRRLYFDLTIPGMGSFVSGSTSYPNYADLRAAATGFSDLAAYFPTEVPVGHGAGARKVSAALVSESFFPLLGVEPAAGRLFTGKERAPVAVVSGRMARRLSGGEDVPLGAKVLVGGQVYTIVAVLPREFTGVELSPVDLWLPLDAAAQVGMGSSWREQRGSSFLEIVGRLSPGATEPQAEGQASGVFQRALRQDDPQTTARVSTGPIQRATGPSDPAGRRLAFWLTGASFLVLLIACGNVAHLLVVRNLGRRRELALKLALGCGRGRLVAASLGESLVLATLGAAAALALYVPGLRLMQWLLLPSDVILQPARSLAILAGLLPAAGVLAGLAPALWASREQPAEVLKTGGSAVAGPSGALRILVAFQVALTLLALVGAGLFLLSLRRVAGVHLGFEAERVVVAVFDTAPATPMGEVERRYREALEGLLRMPGVERASLAAGIPFSSSFALTLAVPGRDLPRPPTGGPYVNAVSPGFFRTLGTRLRRGRMFEEREGDPVAIVNETMARLVWPREEPVGECLQIGGADAPCATVVGVVEDAVRSRLGEASTPQYYIPLSQAPALLSSRALFVRSAEGARLESEAIRRQILALSPNLPYVEVFRLADLAATQARPWRAGMVVFSLFGALALVLSVVGVHGTVAQAVARRTRELGIRFALGAPWRAAVRSLVAPTLSAAAVGAAVGLGAALLAGSYLQPLLFEVSARDLRVLALSVLLVLLVAWVAAYAPARRVRRIAPADVLREE